MADVKVYDVVKVGEDELIGEVIELRRDKASIQVYEETALADSFMVSFDNAHAVHPNHPELSDPTNKTVLGGGIAIKRHANFNYTTDAVSSAVIKGVWKNAGVKYQDFYMRSDLPCGGTLGAISSSHLSVLSVDVGLPQLAMHSACETACLSDVDEGINGVTAFYSVAFSSDGDRHCRDNPQRSFKPCENYRRARRRRDFDIVGRREQPFGCGVFGRHPARFQTGGQKSRQTTPVRSRQNGILRRAYRFGYHNHRRDRTCRKFGKKNSGGRNDRLFFDEIIRHIADRTRRVDTRKTVDDAF